MKLRWERYYNLSLSPLQPVTMTSSVLQSVGVAVGWRSHSVLEDEPDSPLPDRFRKRPSSSSLNTLRMSLRKRLPLRSVTLNVQENPTWEALESRQKPGAVRSLTRSARSTLGNVSQVTRPSDQGLPRTAFVGFS